MIEPPKHDDDSASAAPRAESEDTEWGIPDSVPVTLTPYEVARSRAVATYRAARAAEDPSVRAERRRITGDPQGVLSPDQARDLLDSPAVRWFGDEEFRGHGVPLIGHRADVVEEIANPGRRG